MVIRGSFLLIALIVFASACASGKAVNNTLGKPTHVNTSTEPSGPAKK
jgi:hypothetical protein